jgi:Lipocalin-like domain
MRRISWATLFLEPLPTEGGEASGAEPSTPTLRQRLIGTWMLVSFQRRKSPDAQWKNAYGDNPRGYVIYDATGHMAVQIEKMPAPPRLASDDNQPTAEEAKLIYAGYVAYFGTFSVDEGSRVVTHRVEGALNPAYFGTEQRRPATLEGDRLTLSDQKTYRAVWERVK